MNNKTLHTQLSELIGQLQSQIDHDRADGTRVPEFYNELQELIDQAKGSLLSGDTEKTLEFIGEINLDTLQEIDHIDDTLGEVLQKLESLYTTYISKGTKLPLEIEQELGILRKLLKKYDI